MTEQTNNIEWQKHITKNDRRTNTLHRMTKEQTNYIECLKNK